MSSELVFPGQSVPAKHVNLKLGPGLQQQASYDNPSESTVVSTKAGLLQHSANRSKWWVDSNARRYVPAPQESVVGAVTQRLGEGYRVDIGGAHQASLDALAFEGATKRNKPNLKVGSLVYARVSLAHKDMEPELECFDAQTRKSEGYGELKGGFVIEELRKSGVTVPSLFYARVPRILDASILSPRFRPSYMGLNRLLCAVLLRGNENGREKGLLNVVRPTELHRASSPHSVSAPPGRISLHAPRGLNIKYVFRNSVDQLLSTVFWRNLPVVEFLLSLDKTRGVKYCVSIASCDTRDGDQLVLPQIIGDETKVGLCLVLGDTQAQGAQLRHSYIRQLAILMTTHFIPSRSIPSMDINCLIPANPDVTGVGVRLSIYSQNILCFVPAIAALLDFRITTYEMESLETQAMTNLILAFAILISCGVQALTLGLSSYHASIVLSMSWINNTNAFIYFVLYVHYKAKLNEGPGLTPVKPEWKAWKAHVMTQLRALLHLPYGLANEASGEEPTEGGTHEDMQGPAVRTSSAKILFGRVALLMGSLHLTLTAALGIWLWSDIRSFGQSTSTGSCATDYLDITILGARVPFASNPLRVTSLVIYSLFLLPGFNLLLPMALFLGFFIWHHSWYGEVARRSTSPVTAKAPHLPFLKSLFTQPLADVCTACIKSSIFPVCVGLVFLFAVNIFFITDIELTLLRNKALQAPGEAEWGFGQVLAVLLLVMPLRDLVEMILARRQRRQEKQIKDHEWKAAIMLGKVDDILKMVREGADPNVRANNGQTALEVVTVAEDWRGVRILAEAHTDVNPIFEDGRTALHVAVSHKRWDLVPILVDKDTDLTSKPPDGNTALELAVREENWNTVNCLVEHTGQVALEVLIAAGSWEHALELLKKGDVDVNIEFGGTAVHFILSVSFQAELTVKLIKALIQMSADTAKILLPDGKSLDVWAHSSERQKDIRSLFISDSGGVILDHILSRIRAGATLIEILVQTKDWQGALDVIPSIPDVNITFTDGSTLFGAAIFARKWDVVGAVIQAGADVKKELKYRGYNGVPLQAAYDNGAPIGVLELMLEKGASPNTLGGQWNDEACLHKACREGHENVVSLLLKYGANLYIQNSIEWTPLYDACRNGHAKCVQLLLEAGANIKAQDRIGNTALHIACHNGRVDCAKLLLEHGADTSIKDQFSQTAFQVASRFNHTEVVELFLSYGVTE
ncbi:hypothetical protein NMY22_g10206 [Coprinellus aureogranulatus]|nr:hypothetical protein NMY22_g10206 [Coprinellus aureogranulatus]